MRLGPAATGNQDELQRRADTQLERGRVRCRDFEDLVELLRTECNAALPKMHACVGVGGGSAQPI